MNPKSTILRVDGCVSQAVRGAAGSFLSRNLLETIEHFVCYLTGMKLEVGLSGYLLMPLISVMTDSDDGTEIMPEKHLFDCHKAKVKERPALACTVEHEEEFLEINTAAGAGCSQSTAATEWYALFGASYLSSNNDKSFIFFPSVDKWISWLWLHWDIL